ncbi:MAG TPA: hypothetical protein VNH11_24495 [Pirellulales bacterium]|nr:hypothetical protein [Pirellulales bacterium]
MLNASFRRLLAAVLVSLAGTSALAVPPTDTLLPESTKGYLSVPDVDALVERWDQTPLGKLLNDPAMKPFTDDLRRQLKEKWSKSHARLGISIADLQGLATGEVALAVVTPKEGRATLVILADVTGKEKEAAATLAKIAANLKAQGARATRQKQHGVDMSVFETAPKDHRDHGFTTVHYIKDGLFVASDNLAIAGDVAGRLDKPQKHTLAGVEAYRTVIERCGKSDQELSPDVRWFIDPIGLAEALRTWETARRKGGTDYLKVAKNQGFMAVKGVGGVVHLGLGRYGMLHRTFVYAPPPYELAMRMAVFPNGGSFAPQDWVARDVANYFSFEVDIVSAFDRFDTLFDEVYGEEGVWKDTLEGIEDDPNGPQINLRNDIVQHLGQRATIIADYELPITPTSQRKLLAIETTNAQALAVAIEKSMSGDDRVRKLEIEGHDVWEIIPEDESMPALEIDDAAGGSKRRSTDEDEEERPRQVKLANSAVTVAKGHLMVASHIDLLREVLAGVAKADRLVDDRDYQKVQAEAIKLGSGNDCAQGFARTDEQYRVMYELFKQGRLPEADTFMAHFINFLMGEEKEGVTRKPRLDGSKLPDYKLVQHYLGPGGSFSTSEKEGWFLVGFTVSEGAQLANEARAAKTKK